MYEAVCSIVSIFYSQASESSQPDKLALKVWVHCVLSSASSAVEMRGCVNRNFSFPLVLKFFKYLINMY